MGQIAQAKNRQHVGRCSAVPFLRKKEPFRNSSVSDEYGVSYITVGANSLTINRNYGRNKFMVKQTTFTVLVLFSLLVVTLAVSLH